MTVDSRHPLLYEYITDQSEGASSTTKVWAEYSTIIPSGVSTMGINLTVAFKPMIKTDTEGDNFVKLWLYEDDNESYLVGTLELLWKNVSGNIELRIRIYDLINGYTYSPSGYQVITPNNWYYLHLIYVTSSVAGRKYYVDIYEDINKATTFDSVSETSIGSGKRVQKVKITSQLDYHLYDVGSAVKMMYGPFVLRWQPSATVVDPDMIQLSEDENGLYHYIDLCEDAIEFRVVEFKDAEEYFSKIEALEAEVAAGSNTTQTSKTAVNWGSYFNSIFSDICDNLDDTLTLGSYSINLQGLLAPLNDPFNSFWEICRDTFEIITDSLINVLKAIVNSGTFVIEGLHTGLTSLIEDQIVPFIAWIKNTFVSPLVYAIYNLALTNISQVSNYLGTFILALLTQLESISTNIIFNDIAVMLGKLIKKHGVKLVQVT